jgi:acyl-CoA thioesterase-1
MFTTLSAALFQPICKGLRNCTRVGLIGLGARPQRRAWLASAALLSTSLWAQMALAKPNLGHALPKPATVMVLGDSLSAEYGLARGEGWVALTEARMKTLNWPVKVVNASLSGETTAGALSRLPALLKQHQPTHVVIELGANDALRGLSVAVARTQLGQLVAMAQASKARVVLVGMMAPPNLGRRYGDAFAQMYADVARERSTGLVPFMLKGVADRAEPREWFQPDGLHPRALAHPTIRDNIWPAWEASLLGR